MNERIVTGGLKSFVYSKPCEQDNEFERNWEDNLKKINCQHIITFSHDKT